MTDQVLDILKLVLLALLYLFFARVLWAVWSEVRAPVDMRGSRPLDMPMTAAPAPASADPTTPAVAPASRERRPTRPARGRGTRPGRLVIIEPKDRRGTAFAIGADITIGRENDNILLISGDSYISSHHARVRLVDGVAMVEDLGSTNGTFHNGTRLTGRRKLAVGDRVQVGFTVLEVQ